MEPKKFEIETASKDECVAESRRKLDLACRVAGEGKDKMADMAFGLALKAENAGFDGRA